MNIPKSAHALGQHQCLNATVDAVEACAIALAFEHTDEPEQTVTPGEFARHLGFSASPEGGGPHGHPIRVDRNVGLPSPAKPVKVDEHLLGIQGGEIKPHSPSATLYSGEWPAFAVYGRLSLLASATAATFGVRRASNFTSHGRRAPLR